MTHAQNTESIQRSNRNLVLRLLLDNEKISRVDIATLSGLNKATVSNIISEFEADHIVTKCGPIENMNGRKTAGLRINTESTSIISVRINRGLIAGALCDIIGNILEYAEADYPPSATVAEILETIQTVIDEMMNRVGSRKILGISIATIGPLVHRDGSWLVQSYDYPQLAKIDIRAEVEKMYPPLRVIIDHDANTASLLEWRSYRQQTQKNKGILLLLSFGAGIGGGIVVDGSSLHGCLGVAGEIGHMGINFNAVESTEVGYVRGALETYASPHAIKRDTLSRLFEFPQSKITENSTLEDIYQYYEEGDELATWAVNRMAFYLGYGLTNLVYLLNPDVIILGDEIIRSDKFLKVLRKYMRRTLSEDIVHALNIQYSKEKAGPRAMLIGASIRLVNVLMDSMELVEMLKCDTPPEFKQ